MENGNLENGPTLWFTKGQNPSKSEPSQTPFRLVPLYTVTNTNKSFIGRPIKNAVTRFQGMRSQSATAFRLFALDSSGIFWYNYTREEHVMNGI